MGVRDGWHELRSCGLGIVVSVVFHQRETLACPMEPNVPSPPRSHPLTITAHLEEDDGNHREANECGTSEFGYGGIGDNLTLKAIRERNRQEGTIWDIGTGENRERQSPLIADADELAGAGNVNGIVVDAGHAFAEEQ